MCSIFVVHVSQKHLHRRSYFSLHNFINTRSKNQILKIMSNEQCIEYGCSFVGKFKLSLLVWCLAITNSNHSPCKPTVEESNRLSLVYKICLLSKIEIFKVNKNISMWDIGLFLVCYNIFEILFRLFINECRSRNISIPGSTSGANLKGQMQCLLLYQS